MTSSCEPATIATSLGLTGDGEPPNMDLELNLCRGSKYSYLLNRLSNPKTRIFNATLWLSNESLCFLEMVSVFYG